MMDTTKPSFDFKTRKGVFLVFWFGDSNKEETTHSVFLIMINGVKLIINQLLV